MKPETLNLVSYSGGKDSGALVLWMLENKIPNMVLVFADTKWEHPLTYRYAFEFARSVGLRLKIVESEGMAAMCSRKGLAPSATRRFCTEELKLKPFRAYVRELHADGFDTVIWMGIRADESPSRAKMPATEDSTYYDCEVRRPILDWTIADVIAAHQRHGLELNPLYKLGMGRVGCMPCIMANKGELGAIAARFPEVFDKVAALEEKMGRTWWAPGTTPDKFASVLWEGEEGQRRRLATAKDVRTWATTESGQVPGQVVMFPQEVPACSSKYNLCE